MSFQPTDIIPLIDLTTLKESDTVGTVEALCKQAITPFGQVAAVCIYPQFIPIAKKSLEHTSVRIATVANFPKGTQSIPDSIKEIILSITEGADEIDVVFPYRAWLEKEDDVFVRMFLKECRRVCKNQCLKVILETGELKTKDNILTAAKMAIDAGADFIKTSTGKSAVGATLPAAETMLEAIKETGSSVGIKISGGVSTVKEALPYLSLIKEKMGKPWITSEHVRFGASRLLTDILAGVHV